MSVEGVCNPVCAADEDEDGIWEGGTERGPGSNNRGMQPWVEVKKRRTTYESPG